MAARRIASSSINWAAIAEKVPDAQRHFYNSLKAKSDGYLRRVLANPEAAPKIDFASYKSKIPAAGLVDSLQKQYEAITVPYPADKLSGQIAAQEKEQDQKIKDFIVGSNQRIKEHEAGLEKWDSVLPFEEMTMEDFRDAFPDLAMDPLNRPTLWPHGEEDQPGYVDPEKAAHGH